jgi:hypothetical protein
MCIVEITYINASGCNDTVIISNHTEKSDKDQEYVSH